MLMLTFPSPSSNAKQRLANGNADVEGNIAESEALNSATIDGKEVVVVQSAIPMTPSGNEDGRKSDIDACHAGGGCEV